jgi:hypothetical protein
VGGDDELHGGVPVRVEHYDGVVVQLLEHLGAQPLQARNQADFLALVEFQTLGIREHDGRDVREQSAAGLGTPCLHSGQ